MNQKEIEKASFEELMSELETIVESLESGDVELEKALEIFELGMKHTKELSRRLKSAEDRIKKVVKDSDGSLGLEVVEEPSDDD